MTWVPFAVLFLLFRIPGFLLTGIEMKYDGDMMTHGYIKTVTGMNSK